jgi:hypothetical protein
MLLISAYQVTGITSVSHCAWLTFYVFTISSNEAYLNASWVSSAERKKLITKQKKKKDPIIGAKSLQRKEGMRFKVQMNALVGNTSFLQ